MDSAVDYYSAIQLRSDKWSTLREVTTALSRADPGKIREEQHTRANDLFTWLAVIEPFWAFPGMAAFGHLRRLLEHKNYQELAFVAHRISRALSTGAYRRRRCHRRDTPSRRPRNRTRGRNCNRVGSLDE